MVSASGLEPEGRRFKSCLLDQFNGKMMITQKEVLDLIDYDATSGYLHWKNRGVEWFRESKQKSAAQICKEWNLKYAGKIAGWFATGYGGYLLGSDLATWPFAVGYLVLNQPSNWISR